MLASYFDLGSNPDVQQAATQPFETQVRKRLAVTPAVNLKGALEQQARSRAAGQTLAIATRQNAATAQRNTALAGEGERRLALEERKANFDQGQLPWATVGGALSAGVQLYGGYQALQNANEVQARLNRNQAIQTAGLTEQERQTAALLNLYGQQKQVYDTSPTASPVRNLRWALPMAMRPPSQWTLQ